MLSGRFQKGPHVFDVVVGPGGVVERIRIEPKKDSPADYVATVARLGLELGPDGPVTRERADEARGFLDRRRLELEREALCGDILQPGTLVAELAAGGDGGAGGGGAALAGMQRRGRRWRRQPRSAAGHPSAAAREPDAAHHVRRRRRALESAGAATSQRSTRQTSPVGDGALSTPLASREDTRQR